MPVRSPRRKKYGLLDDDTEGEDFGSLGSLLKSPLVGLPAGIMDMAGMAGGLLNSSQELVSNLRHPDQTEPNIVRFPEPSGDAMREAAGTDNPAGLAGEMFSPFGTAMKGVAMLGKGFTAAKAGLPLLGLLGKSEHAGALVADDLARVNFPKDVPAPPELTREANAAGKGGRIIGAPEHVKTRADEVKIMDDYLGGAEQGAVGRDWYAGAASRVDRDTGNVSGLRPGAADQSAAIIGEFSPRATLEANRLAQIRAINQHATGLPVSAGMGPRNKAAQGLLDTGTFSADEALKVGPFSMQVRGLEAPRGVHDVRDIASFGYADGKGTGVANHRWMDKITDEMVDEANKRKLAGFDDWTHNRLQAARWVKHKADEMGVDPSALRNEFGPADDWLSAKVFSEAIPSKELVDMNRLSDEGKRAYTASYAAKFSNQEGQNALAHQQGLLSPEMEQFVGEWDGNTTPNIVTTIMADSAKGDDIISGWSQEGIGFHAALKGLLGGQADVATSFLRKPNRIGETNSFRIPQTEGLTEEGMTSTVAAARTAMAENKVPGTAIANYRNGKELELTWLPPNEGDEGYAAWKKLEDVAKPAYEIKSTLRTPAQKAAVKEMDKIRKSFRDAISGVADDAIPAKNSGGLTTYLDEYKPSAWMEHLQNPTQRAKVEGMLPKIAAAHERDVDVLPLTDKGREIYVRALQIIKEGGLKGVEDAVKQGILPAAVIGALLSSASQAPEQPSPSRGLL